MNLYNVMVYYKGEGSLNVYIPGLGETSIIYGRPLYLKNAGFKAIEALRQYRSMMVDIKIGASASGAFRIVDLAESHNPYQRQPIQEVKQAVSTNDINSILSSGTSGPIPVEKKEEKVDYKSFVLTSGSFEGKTLAEVDKLGKLKSVYNGFKSRNPEVKKAIEEYYKSLVE